MSRADGQRLFALQAAFKDGDANALGEMYSLLAEIAHKTINRLSQADKAVKALGAEEREQKAHDAATYIIEQYLKRPDFLITDSITGYLYLRVIKELKYTRKCDRMLVYTDVLPERAKAAKRYAYIATNVKTGEETTYCGLEELYADPEFKALRRKRLAECIETGRRWRRYTFDMLEIDE